MDEGGLMKISGKTAVTGLIGFPVGHSISPAMHNAAFAHLGLDWCYVAFPVRPERLGEAIGGVRALGIRGINVTVPHKERVIAFLDGVSDEASFIGAVNTVVSRDGMLTGFNTDGRGFMTSLDEAGIDAGGRDILIIGAGGASRAVGYYLADLASRLFISDLDRDKAEALAGHLNALRGNTSVAGQEMTGDRDFLSHIGIVINATPLGLKPDDPLPADTALLREGQVVCDLIYGQTTLLQKAKEAGCITMNGLGMLLWQGVYAFEIWTGIAPPVGVMRAALEGALKMSGT
jgi:shikimate dehydrogenase